MFTAEEPTRYGSVASGSRAPRGGRHAGAADALRDADGGTLDEAGRRRRGRRRSRRPGCPGHYAAFIELHIEQGPELEAAGRRSAS